MSKSTVVIRQVTFGEGRAKICVPLTSGNREEMEQALEALK